MLRRTQSISADHKRLQNHKQLVVNIPTTMRSLPPPRITRKRKWKRFKRSLRYFFHKGRFSDPGSYLYKNKSSISKIKKSRLASKFGRVRKSKSESFKRNGTMTGVKTVSLLGKLALRASAPILRPFGSTNLLNVSVKF